MDRDTLPRLRPLSRRGARVAGAAAGMLLAVGTVWWMNHPSGTATRPQAPDSGPAPVAAESQPPVTGAIAPPPGPTGKLRILTNPPDAVISIDGRRVGVGSAFDLVVAAGPRRLRVRAPGYETFDTTIVVQVGETHRLGRITLRGRGAGGGV